MAFGQTVEIDDDLYIQGREFLTQLSKVDGKQIVHHAAILDLVKDSERKFIELVATHLCPRRKEIYYAQMEITEAGRLLTVQTEDSILAFIFWFSLDQEKLSYKCCLNGEWFENPTLKEVEKLRQEKPKLILI